MDVGNLHYMIVLFNSIGSLRVFQMETLEYVGITYPVRGSAYIYVPVDYLT